MACYFERQQKKKNQSQSQTKIETNNKYAFCKDVNLDNIRLLTKHYKTKLQHEKTCLQVSDQARLNPDGLANDLKFCIWKQQLIQSKQGGGGGGGQERNISDCVDADANLCLCCLNRV